MSDNYNALDTSTVKVTRDDTVEQVNVSVSVPVEQEQEVVHVFEKVVEQVLVVQRPILCFLEKLVRPYL